MCGYLRRELSQEQYSDFLAQYELYPQPPSIETGLQHFYPAVAGHIDRKIKNVIIRSGEQLRSVDAIWWYDCALKNGEVVAGPYESFNARNLGSTFWKGAIRHHRGVVVATGIGESKKPAGKSKSSFLMTAKEPFFVGVVYKPLTSDLFSTAVITRDKHLNFEKYHDKAFPLFLPKDKDFLKLWLSDASESDVGIAGLLAHPQLFTDLEVLEVKTFKGGEPRTKKTVSETLLRDN